MFLHETGEDSESYSRQDLSSLNAVGTQRPSRIGGQTQALPPPQQGHQIIIMASQLPNNPPLKPEPMSRSDSGDGPGLPPTANWAKNPQVEQSRRSSQAASRATPSPKSTHAKLIAQRPESRTTRTTEQSSSEDKSRPPAEASPESPPKVLAPAEQEPNLSPSVARFEAAVRAVVGSDWKWSLDRSLYDDTSLRIIDNYPPLIAENGGAVRFAMKAQQSSQREQDVDPSLGFTATTEDEEHFAGGSLQLGGEPETVEEPNDGSNHSLGNRRNLTHQGSLNISPGHSQPFDSQVKLGTEFASLGIGGRSLTPQQLRNYSPLNSTGQQHDALLEQFQRGGSTNTSQHQPQLSNPFQVQNQQLSAISRHGRQASRYNFSHEPSSSIGSIKPSTNAQLMAQQSAMMPHQQNKYGNQPLQQPALHSNFYSGVQGPPPGLRSSGTPPISGGGMFGQGHGFTSTAGFGGNLTGKNNDDLRDMFRGRNGIGNGIGSDAGKREYMFPSFLQKPSHSPAPAPGPSNSLHGSQIGASIGHQDIISMKPKKKGKKHRHANTSSSGGGAIVDLADPSILQARMHHAGVGQGPYGGTQGQGGYNSHAMMYGNGGYGGRW